MTNETRDRLIKTLDMLEEGESVLFGVKTVNSVLQGCCRSQTGVSLAPFFCALRKQLGLTDPMKAGRSISVS